MNMGDAGVQASPNGTAPDLLTRGWRFLLTVGWIDLLLQAAHRMLAAGWLLVLAAVVLQCRTPRAIPGAEEAIEDAARSAAVDPLRLAVWGFVLADLAVVAGLGAWWLAVRRGVARSELVGVILFGAVVVIGAMATIAWIRS